MISCLVNLPVQNVVFLLAKFNFTLFQFHCNDVTTAVSKNSQPEKDVFGTIEYNASMYHAFRLRSVLCRPFIMNVISVENIPIKKKYQLTRNIDMT